MDTNGDGKLDKAEIKAGYAEFFGKTISDEEVDEMFSKVDVDAAVPSSLYLPGPLNSRVRLELLNPFSYSSVCFIEAYNDRSEA